MRSLSVVIVTHDNREAVRKALPALTAQLDDGDELIVVDNDSADGTAGAARELAAEADGPATGQGSSPGSCRAPAWPSDERPSSEPVASQASSSSTTRTSTFRCGCGLPATGWASSRLPGSSTTTSSRRGQPSGATWSATDGQP